MDPRYSEDRQRSDVTRTIAAIDEPPGLGRASGDGETSGDSEVRGRNQKTMERMFAAISVGDVEAHLSCLTDDAILELPYADPPVRLQGKEEIRARVEPGLALFKFVLTIDRITQCADPDTMVLEFSSRGHVATTQKPYGNSYIAVVAFRGGKVRRQREYYNPLATLHAVTPAPPADS